MLDFWFVVRHFNVILELLSGMRPAVAKANNKWQMEHL